MQNWLSLCYWQENTKFWRTQIFKLSSTYLYFHDFACIQFIFNRKKIKMKEIRTEIIINSKPEKVWDILTDFERHPEWNPFIKSISGNKKVGEHLAIVENGKIYLWSEPSNPAELSSDSMNVGHRRRPLAIPAGARAGLVSILSGDAAFFSLIEDPVKALIVCALFELKRGKV